MNLKAEESSLGGQVEYPSFLMVPQKAVLERGKSGPPSFEACGKGFHSNVHVDWGLSLGDWKLQAEDISEQELQLREWQSKSDFVFWWRDTERRAKDWDHSEDRAWE